MTSDPLRPSLPPHLKAGPASSSFKSTARPSSPALRPPSPDTSNRPRLSKKASTRDDAPDIANEKATVNLIRRVLCPQTGGYGASTPQPLEELLPPLTSSNDVDHQLYAIIALVVKEFVYSWYSQITSDQAFINEVLQVIAHCTRALEQRMRQVDVAQVVLDEVPALVEAHITSYRLAKQQSTLSGLSPSTHAIYHSLHPHPALSPVPDPSDTVTFSQQQENETLYRNLLARGTLAVLLPTEDLENVCLRTLVGDILADLILGHGVSEQISEGWFLWETVTKLLELMRRRDARESDMAKAPGHQQSQLKKFGLLSTREEFRRDHSMPKTQSQVSFWLWSALHYIYLTYVALRFIVTGLFRTASTPSTSPSRLSCSSSISGTSAGHVFEASSRGSITGPRPVLNYRLYSMLSQLMDVPRRMPWLGGFIALIQYLILAGPGKLGDTGSALDRFLHETIQNHVLTPTLLPNLLLASRAALFPSNARPIQVANQNDMTRTPASAPRTSVHSATPSKEGGPSDDGIDTNTTSASSGASVTMIPAPASSPSSQGLQQRPSPSAPEIAAIKRRCAESLLSLVPRRVAQSLFGIPPHPTTTTDDSCLDRQEEKKQGAQDEDGDEENATTPPNSTDPEEALLLAAIEDDLLDLFTDDYCNKHLIYSIIETILARLLPELSERSIGDLMEDRGVSQSHTPSDPVPDAG